jgi:hypothetical protein
MKNPDDPNEIKNDVLHSQGHTQLSSEEIAKAIARHKREHGEKQTVEAKPKGGKRK